MQFSIQVSGWEPIALGLTETVARAADLREMNDELRAEYTRQNRENLLGEGALVGGWRPLTAGTVRDKQRKGYGGKRIEERTGNLFRSLTESGADGFIEQVSEREIVYGSSLPYVLPQHEDRALIPEPNGERYAAIFIEHAAKVGREEGFAVL